MKTQRIEITFMWYQDILKIYKEKENILRYIDISGSLLDLSYTKSLYMLHSSINQLLMYQVIKDIKMVKVKELIDKYEDFKIEENLNKLYNEREISKLSMYIRLINHINHNEVDTEENRQKWKKYIEKNI